MRVTEFVEQRCCGLGIVQNSIMTTNPVLGLNLKARKHRDIPDDFSTEGILSKDLIKDKADIL